MFGSKAKAENAQLQTTISQLQMRTAQLEQVIRESGAGDVVAVKDAHQNAINSYNSYVAWAEQQRQSINADLDGMSKTALDARVQLDAISRELVDARTRNELQQDGLFDFPNPAEDSVRLQGELQDARSRIKDMVRSKQAVRSTTQFVFNNSAAKGRKFVSDMSKMMLRAYNAEAENSVLTVRAGNLNAALKRVECARDQAARLGSMIDLSITSEYHTLRIRELELAAMHLQAKDRAKEHEREERARLREERKAQAELEAERKRLEKERTHYQSIIAALRPQGRLDEIAALEEKVTEIAKGIEDVDYRQANIRAGYVYIISNLGAFGEGIVKIGMTRRLTPMDRVNELGSASVPFKFDVHALFFSDDAVGVEAELHRRFADRKVNKVNGRKEFFYATPAEVRTSLADVAGNLLEFKEEAEAEQFRESQRIGEESELADSDCSADLTTSPTRHRSSYIPAH